MKDPVISVSNVSFYYGKDPVIEQANVSIYSGEFIGIMGPNGGGKTTFLKLLMGFLQPQKGNLLIFGQTPENARLKIGYVPQVHRVDRDFPISVSDLVLLGALTHQFSYPKDIQKKLDILLEEFGLSSYKKEAFSSLSGGMAQRALIARSLLGNPDLLLLDEPTANTDAKSSSFILDKLAKLKGKTTTLLVTHDLRTIVEKVDRILCIETQISSLLPQEICEHFALGLYHTPLLGLPSHHFPQKGP